MPIHKTQLHWSFLEREREGEKEREREREREVKEVKEATKS